MAIALVTGASRGIGKATALQLAGEGYTVAVNYHRNIKAATDVIRTIVDAGGKAFAVRADISDEAQVLAMFESLDREGEPLTALVNNAGILFEQSTIENLSAERINRVLATNVTGYFLCCREAVNACRISMAARAGPL
jgi:NAD(P)-dependent dehydrogenase (short-subunit alcohol dehydrogenase family)